MLKNVRAFFKQKKFVNDFCFAKNRKNHIGKAKIKFKSRVNKKIKHAH